MSANEQQRLDEIVASQNLKSTEAYLHKLNLQNVYFAKSRMEAEVLLYEWYKRANASSISLIKKMAKSVKEHWYGILSHFDS